MYVFIRIYMHFYMWFSRVPVLYMNIVIQRILQNLEIHPKYTKPNNLGLFISPHM